MNPNRNGDLDYKSNPIIIEKKGSILMPRPGLECEVETFNNMS